MFVAGIALVLLALSSGGLASSPAEGSPSASQQAQDERIAELEADVAALRAEIAALATRDMRIPDQDTMMDMFLKIPSIPGDSARDGHEDEIEVMAWSWGAQNPTGERALSRDIILLKSVDSATAPLFLASASGEVLPDATIALRRTVEGETSDYLILRLADVRITSVEHGIDGRGELVTLSAAKITMEYDHRIVAGWDFVANAPT